MRVVNDQVPQPFTDVSLDMLMRPNYREFVSKGLRLPFHLLGVAREVGRALPRLSTVDLAIALADLLPSGLYTGSGIEEYIHTVLSDPDRTDDFRELDCELYLAATDLDTCERIVLGAKGWDDVPISTAVRASAALPMVYQPTQVKDRELVDGGIVSTTNLDIAVEAGAKLIVVVNPLVPYVNDFTKEIPTLFGTRTRRVSDMGFPKIGYQTFKLLAYQRLHEVARGWRERYPGVDIVLIEPDTDDELMFQTNILDYRSRLEVARHGFQSVTVKLAADYENLREVGRAARVRDLGHARAQGGAPLRGRAGREVARLAADPRADHQHAAAPVGRRVGGELLARAAYGGRAPAALPDPVRCCSPRPRGRGPTSTTRGRRRLGAERVRRRVRRGGRRARSASGCGFWARPWFAPGELADWIYTAPAGHDAGRHGSSSGRCRASRAGTGTRPSTW